MIPRMSLVLILLFVFNVFYYTFHLNFGRLFVQLYRTILFTYFLPPGFYVRQFTLNLLLNSLVFPPEQFKPNQNFSYGQDVGNDSSVTFSC